MKVITHPEQPITENIHIADGVFVKAFRVPKKGTILPQHAHAYSHTSYIAAGAVHLWADGEDMGEIRAPRGVYVEANTKHLFVITEDNTVILCIHATDHADAIAEHHEIAGDE